MRTKDTTDPMADTTEELYTRQYFEVFAAVVLFMTGLALQFHFGQYVAYRGHGVSTLGWILSISMLGTLSLRLQIGRWIDLVGCRPTFLIGAVVVAASAVAIQFAAGVVWITLLRALWAMAAAAVMTTVAVFAAQVAPPLRRAESIGTMGLAGFLGMIIGPTLGDFIFAGSVDSIWPYRVFFMASAACSLGAGGIMMLVKLPEPTNGNRPAMGAGATSPAGPSQLSVIFKHWPGAVLLIGFVFSMVFCLQSLFLERLAEERGFADIKLFFLVYGPTAILLRIIFRRVPQQLGRTRAVIGGMLLLATGLIFLRGISTQWELIVPGLLMGAGHCFIFPSMIDLAAERLPNEYRGTGTAVILGAGDLGMLVGFVSLGEVIESLGFDTALAILAGALVGAALFFAVARRHAVFSRRPRLAPGSVAPVHQGCGEDRL